MNNKEEKINIKRDERTRSLTCKLDSTFSDNMTLIANPENLEIFILMTEKNYNITLNSDIEIKVDNDINNKCIDPHTKKIYKSLKYKDISALKPEPAKKRFYYTISLEISPEFEIPFFFYLIIKVKMSIKQINLRYLDMEEEVDTYCIAFGGEPCHQGASAASF